MSKPVGGGARGCRQAARSIEQADVPDPRLFDKVWPRKSLSYLTDDEIVF